MFSDLTIPAIIGGALIDSVNPCAFAVLIFLLSYLLAIGSPKLILKVGLVYIATVFLVYFLAGLGILKVLTFFGIAPIIYTIAAVILIFVGLVNVKDFFWYGKYFIMEVPLSWRPKMQEILRKVSNPIGAFGAGFVVSLFLVPCASGPYLSILGLLATKVDSARTMSLLFLYNLVFVLPMIIITFAMYFGSRMGRIEQWRKDNLKLLHLITGAVMLFVGGYLIYTWI